MTDINANAIQNSSPTSSVILQNEKKYIPKIYIPSHLSNINLPRNSKEDELLQKVAKFVHEKGNKMESMLHIKQRNSDKFSFLKSNHYLFEYYSFLKQRLKQPVTYAFIYCMIILFF